MISTLNSKIVFCLNFKCKLVYIINKLTRPTIPMKQKQIFNLFYFNRSEVELDWFKLINREKGSEQMCRKSLGQKKIAVFVCFFVFVSVMTNQKVVSSSLHLKKESNLFSS